MTDNIIKNCTGTSLHC